MTRPENYREDYDEDDDEDEKDVNVHSDNIAIK